jgi:hypothetical protein
MTLQRCRTDAREGFGTQNGAPFKPTERDGRNNAPMTAKTTEMRVGKRDMVA